MPKSFNVIVGTDSFLFSALYAGAKGRCLCSRKCFSRGHGGTYDAFVHKEAEKGAELQLQVNALRSAVSNPPIAPSPRNVEASRTEEREREAAVAFYDSRAKL